MENILHCCKNVTFHCKTKDKSHISCVRHLYNNKKFVFTILTYN